jgi:DNA-binding NarL/FixJ family response regulator
VTLQKANPNRESRISVLVADDHGILRDGVQCILERHAQFSVIASVPDADAALREAERHKPQVATMDITMPGMNGIDATRILHDKLPETRVLILSEHATPMVVRRAMDAGARGFVPKDIDAEELVRAVRTVASGEIYLAQRLTLALLDHRHRDGKCQSGVEALTTTERNILKLVTEGKSNLEVGQIIGLSRRTVETYRIRLMRKLALENLPSLVKYAIRHGLIPLE